MSTLTEFTDELTTKMKGVSTLLSDDEYTSAINDMLRETGWTFPITSSFQLYWAFQRSKRHCLDMLLTSQAPKFQVDKIRLDQRFDHYLKMIQSIDAAFKEAKEESPEEFTNAEVYMVFGSYISAGFSSDSFGNDTTYQETNKVLITPTE